MKAHGVSKCVAMHLQSLGIEAGAHGLRHSFATGIFQQTKDLLLTQRLLGHSSPAVTAVYAACDQDQAFAAGMGLSVRGP